MKKSTELKEGTKLVSADDMIILTTEYSALHHGWIFAELTYADDSDDMIQSEDVGWLSVSDLSVYELM